MRNAAALLVLLFAASCESVPEPNVAEEEPGVPQAVSADGRFRMKIRDIRQEMDADWGPPHRFRFQGSLERIDPERPGRFLVGAGVHVEAVNGSFADYSPTLSHRRSGRVYFDVQGHGEAAIATIPALTVDVHLAHFTETERKTFAGLEKRQSDPLPCGPFELLVSGSDYEVIVGAAAISAFAADHREFEARVPVQGIHHVWASENLRVFDDGDRELGSFAAAGSGGYTSTHFGTIFPARRRIEWPVTVSIEIPAKVRKETVRFVFEGVDVPAPTD